MRNNTHFSQFIPPTTFHLKTGTWTHVAGAVAGTIATRKTAAAETTVVTIPIQIPSNSLPLQGSKLASIEIDFEFTVAAVTSMAAVINKVTRGADTLPAAVVAQTFTYDTGHDTAPERITQDQHRMTLTITNPFYIDNDEYVLVELTIVCGAAVVVDMLGAVANYTDKG